MRHEICVDAVAVDHGRHYARILAGFGVAPRRVVITLPESANANPGLLADVAANYRRSGYRVAVRAGALGAGNVSGFAHLRFDIVRLRATPTPDDASWRRTLVAIHSIGAAAHVTHVEEAAERNRFAVLGADWLQGHAVGRPGPLPARRPAVRPAVALTVRRHAAEPRQLPHHPEMHPGDMEVGLWTPYW